MNKVKKIVEGLQKYHIDIFEQTILGVRLPYTDFKIMIFLIANSGEAVSRYDLIKQVIGGIITSKAIDIHVTNIREAFKNKNSYDKRYPIKAIRNVGYQIDPLLIRELKKK